MTRTILILQARTGSSRLPYKVLMPLQGIPILSHCIRRLIKIHPDVPVIVATSNLPRDDLIVNLAKNEEVNYYRGSESDVLDRYYKAARKFNARYIVRATGDNPFVDGIEGRKLIKEMLTGKWDYINMTEQVNGKSLPIGVGLEAFSFTALQESWEKGLNQYHREHVNEYVLENQKYFNVYFMPCHPENSFPELRLTIDTEKDILFIKEMLNEINRPALSLSTKEIIAWYKGKKDDFNPH